ncbi:TraR/DksA C4-type zinc finger protein [Paenibacillus sp. JX-17]|uniref:TraR/DksA C4-type zinc finger protein n=1 Tax=Paenibacillus lacisoli TaxID=3064525 RepID=A0ABT9C8W9_9BACL|nr:TraR/DksA C4-type zinc finger protein [Paenibacillus sp. JX-17]MDO7905702.1 TraR/DksA C4-type zinc finger protein [Paenibacillus sp. JX-17]
MNHLTESQLQELKHMLVERKQELERHFEVNDEENSLLGESERMSTGELSAVDNHPADLGTETFERGRDLAINESLSEELDQVNAALQRMEDGTYGICQKSGEEIPFERLQAIPFTEYTIENTPEREISNDRPVEEEVMTLPPKGAGEVRQQHVGRFDDADAWETVEEYGTSNTPAMAAKRDVKDYNENM